MRWAETRKDDDRRFVAPDGSLASAADELLAIIRGAHGAFRARIDEAMVVHYHPCTACTILPTLDLKFLLHHGSFVIQEVAGQEKLLGPAVNLVHRLLKNAVTRQPPPVSCRPTPFPRQRGARDS